ncbi:PEP-CTERM sorting domain-containing protein [Sphingomonas nostoxanthinifaciens]|uniref:PEP-CTERM sorting domain-containing protein n=1 Tax=Sphingomonas nostoxanthinifaciens TaxID=2872652 RepID=UPI001CC1E9F7|nr:PEP-CTERM sorting domain-containing protein [Sphingomonas nostoxanthinifaciens]UAK26340.1 PEP-CTERM sorting domain-containing protein [Sphingomonas nostoxanthinifaciens]
MGKWLVALLAGLTFIQPATASPYDLTFSGASAAGGFSGSLALDPVTGRVSDLLLTLPSYTIASATQPVDMTLWSYDDYAGDFWQIYIYAYNPPEAPDAGLQFDGQLFLAFPDDTLESSDLTQMINTERLIYGTLEMNYDAGPGAAYTGAVSTLALAHVGSIPEPASWISALLGFGLIGVASRRRARLATVGA